MNFQQICSQNRLLHCSAVFLVATIWLFGVSISLASSFLDPSFGTNGVTITSLEGSAGVSSVAIQTDGKIVVAGTVFVASKGHFALVRYTVSGTLDTAFGAQGVVTTAVNANGSDSASAVAIQSDGKLVVAGGGYEGQWPLSNYYLALARYTTTGALDPEFGVAGIGTTPIGTAMAGGASAVAIQPDGRIVVAGTTSPVGNFCNSTPFVTRYTITGSLDTGFGTNGTVGLSCGNCSAWSVVIQPDYKIVVAGGSACIYGTGSGRIFLVRMNQNGSLDTTFGTGGKVQTSGPGNSDVGANGVALQTDGKIVVAGTSVLNYKYRFLAARYGTTGTLDSAFGSGGIVTTSLGPGDDNGRSVAVQPDGRIVVGGVSNDGVRNNFGLIRYLSSGVPDPLWGIGGVVTSSVGASFSVGSSVALQPDGKIVLAGWSSDDSVKTDFAVARYLAGINTHSLYLPIVRKG